MNTIMKLIFGLKRARRDRWMNGWTMAMSCGPRSSVYVYFRDGSCDNGKCGVGVMIPACSEALGWFLLFQKMRAGGGSKLPGC